MSDEHLVTSSSEENRAHKASTSANPRRSLREFLRDDWRLFQQRRRTAQAWFRIRYLQADPRAVGMARIVVGLLLVIDGLRHWREAERYYSNDGVLSNHWLLFQPGGEFNFSLFSSFSSPGEVHVAFGVATLCYLLFAVGYRARLFNILSCLWVTSMDNRLLLVENGGYVVVNLLVFWLLFLPTGQRFSIDSLLRSFKRREQNLSELNDRTPEPWLHAQHVSLASFIVVLNLSIVYIFNVVNKYGSTWRKGQTLHYVLHIDRMATGAAAWLRGYLPFPLSAGMSWLALVLEATIAVAILWPRQRLLSRPLAMVLMAIVHTIFGLTFRLGPFSWFLTAWSLLLLQRCHFDALERWWQRRCEPCELTLDSRSGTLFLLGRWLKRLDRGTRLHFRAANQSGELKLRCGEQNLRQRKALYAALKVLPGGHVGAPLLRYASLGLFDLSWALILGQHRFVDRFFGLKGADHDSPAKASQIPTASPSPLARRWQKRKNKLRELCLVYLLLCAASQLINENKSIPKFLKHSQPWLVRATLRYPRIFQGWGMFSPNPVRVDGIVAIDAITKTGKHIDPLRDKAPDLYLSDERGAGLNQIQQDYQNRIRLDGNKGYRTALQRYILRYHVIRKRPELRIVAFNVYWLSDKNPAPGKIQPTDHKRTCIWSWRSQAHHKTWRKAGHRACKVESAGK